MAEVAGKLELIDHLIDMLSAPPEMAQLRDSLDNILVGHTNLRVWILGRDGKVFYGSAAPRSMRQAGGQEVFLKTQDGWDMRGLRLRIDGPVFQRSEERREGKEGGSTC